MTLILLSYCINHRSHDCNCLGVAKYELFLIIGGLLVLLLDLMPGFIHDFLNTCDVLRRLKATENVTPCSHLPFRTDSQTPPSCARIPFLSESRFVKCELKRLLPMAWLISAWTACWQWLLSHTT